MTLILESNNKNKKMLFLLKNYCLLLFERKTDPHSPFNQAKIYTQEQSVNPLGSFKWLLFRWIRSSEKI